MLPPTEQPPLVDGVSPSITMETDTVLMARELPPRALEIWSSMLGLGLAPAASDDDVATAVAGQRRWSGCIALSGDWRGAVTVSCIDPLARIVTGAMFGMTPEEASDAELQDAIGELANILGGQTKKVLSDRCVLGLPVVIEGDNFEATVPGSHAVVKLHFRCEGHPVEVSVVGANARVSPRRDSHRLSEN